MFTLVGSCDNDIKNSQLHLYHIWVIVRTSFVRCFNILRGKNKVFRGIFIFVRINFYLFGCISVFFLGGVSSFSSSSFSWFPRSGNMVNFWRPKLKEEQEEKKKKGYMVDLWRPKFCLKRWEINSPQWPLGNANHFYYSGRPVNMLTFQCIGHCVVTSA